MINYRINNNRELEEARELYPDSEFLARIAEKHKVEILSDNERKELSDLANQE